MHACMGGTAGQQLGKLTTWRDQEKIVHVTTEEAIVRSWDSN